MPCALAKAAAIMTDSDFTRSEVERLVPRCADRMRVVHLRVSSAYKPPEDKESARAYLVDRYAIPPRFCLPLAPRRHTRT